MHATRQKGPENPELTIAHPYIAFVRHSPPQPCSRHSSPTKPPSNPTPGVPDHAPDLVPRAFPPSSTTAGIVTYHQADGTRPITDTSNCLRGRSVEPSTSALNHKTACMPAMSGPKGSPPLLSTSPSGNKLNRNSFMLGQMRPTAIRLPTVRPLRFCMQLPYREQRSGG